MEGFEWDVAGRVVGPEQGEEDEEADEDEGEVGVAVGELLYWAERGCLAVAFVREAARASPVLPRVSALSKNNQRYDNQRGYHNR